MWRRWPDLSLAFCELCQFSVPSVPGSRLPGVRHNYIGAGRAFSKREESKPGERVSVFSFWENCTQQVDSIKCSHHILCTVMTYKLHANFATVKSFQALSWKEKDGLCNETVSPGLDILNSAVSLAFETHLEGCGNRGTVREWAREARDPQVPGEGVTTRSGCGYYKHEALVGPSASCAQRFWASTFTETQ